MASALKINLSLEELSIRGKSICVCRVVCPVSTNTRSTLTCDSSGDNITDNVSLCIEQTLEVREKVVVMTLSHTTVIALVVATRKQVAHRLDAGTLSAQPADLRAVMDL